MVSLPTEMSEQMVSSWQSAFHLQLHARYKSRFKPDKNPESAESAAWKAVVRHCAIEAAEGDLLGEALEAIHTAGMALASERKSLMNEFAQIGRAPGRERVCQYV